MRKISRVFYDIFVAIVLFIMFCTIMIIITPIMIPLLFIVGFITLISIIIDLFYGK